MRKKRCQIAFDIHPDIRKNIARHAARRNISMNLWILRAIYRAMVLEDQVKDRSN